MAELTPEQRQAAQARGRHFVAATDEQVATLSMQRRVFWMKGRAYLVVRSDGFLETVATLQAVLRQPQPAVERPHPAAPPEPAPSDPFPARPPSPAPAEDGAVAQKPAEAGEPERPAASAPAGRPAPAALAMTARLVASYVATNSVTIGELDGLIRSIHRTVTGLRQPRRP
ncbi:hypothetical protein E0493_05705 [Roseomonas sp. M0104]|uniref:Uncharacterized protein n=1 Tax=Teichococcus coralli TaxID=2545983 RepID=A0A845B9R5_9PROT|nr:MucR family transcriptional regulator [Pseudoroseomonas coralli]MXP62844.1 hypothetical protein [Pseudoroseomonas coralli]